jgi:L,D-transpeptidase YcbB
MNTRCLQLSAALPKALIRILFLTILTTWFSYPFSFQSPPSSGQYAPAAKAQDNIHRYIRAAFDSTGVNDKAYSFRYKSITKTFYQARQWQPVWHTRYTVSAVTDSAWQVLSAVYRYGLIPGFYDVAQIKHELVLAGAELAPDEKDKKFALADIHLTEMLLHLISHLHDGKIPAAGMGQLREEWLAKAGLPLLCEAIAGNGFTRSIEKSQPSYSRYRQLQQALAEFVRTNPPDSSFNLIPDPTAEPLATASALRKVLVQYGFLFPADTLSGLQAGITLGLKKFQQANGLEPDGKPGTKTLASLRRSTWDRFCQVAVNLDRLRKEDITDSVYLFLNIPAFQLYVYEAGHLVQTHRLIVGKPPTPTYPLSSKINYIVVAPQWNVPYSIATGEMLPRIKAKTGYLAENNLMVFNKSGQLVDPYAVDWNKLHAGSFPYTIRQQPGCDNALGNIMFHFPNSYHTFLHDTPARKAFSQAYRALSHGCMRVENPVKLANYILAKTGNTATLDIAEVEDCRLNRKRKQINLRQAFPIHVRYLTCGALQEKVLFYPDIYKQDPALLKSFLQE